MADRSILAIGFSHLQRINEAQQLRVRDGRATFRMTTLIVEPSGRYAPFSTIVDGQETYTEKLKPDLEDIIRKEQPTHVVGSLWGNQHFFLSTFNNPVKFDFVLPPDSAHRLDQDAQLIPYDMMRKLVETHFRRVDFLFSLLHSLCSAPVFLLPSPPPMSDFSPIPAGSSDPRVDEMVSKYGVAPPGLRYKFWKLCEDIYREKAEAHGARLLPLPEGTMTTDGFRRPEFYGTDWIHANIAFGELVLKQLDQNLHGAQKSEVA